MPPSAASQVPELSVRLRGTLAAVLLLVGSGLVYGGQHYLRAQPRYRSDGVQVSGAVYLAVGVVLVAAAVLILVVAKRPVACSVVLVGCVLLAAVGLGLAGYYYAAGVSCACDGG